MCLYPRLLQNRKYVANKKNGGQAPPLLDDRLKWVAVGCQNCIECRKRKAREWQARLMEDIKRNKNGKFIALTFSDEWIAKIIHGYDNESNQHVKGILEHEETKHATGYVLDNEIAIYATRHFLERYRKKYKTSIRHWLVTELGHNGTENIHMHGIIWTDKDLKEIEEIWQYGFMWKGHNKNGKMINYVNEKTVNYIIKYVTKIDKTHPSYRSKILTSPGIGNNYTTHGDHKNNVYIPTETNETYKTRSGHKIALPIYWRNKVYTETEREKLWIEKLDEETRWVMGNKIDISDGDQKYKDALKYAQEINQKLGYGNDQKTEEQEQYERHRRMIMQQTRIAKAKYKEAKKVSSTS